MATDGGDAFRRILDGIRVLVIDDVADNREIERLLLAWHGASVTEAESVAAALASVERAEPQVVVTDIHMPGEDGYALLRKLRERSTASGRRIRVVALTADASERARDATTEAGFDAVLFKPVEPDKLVRMIASLVGRY